MRRVIIIKAATVKHQDKLNVGKVPVRHLLSNDGCQQPRRYDGAVVRDHAALAAELDAMAVEVDEHQRA